VRAIDDKISSINAVSSLALRSHPNRPEIALQVPIRFGAALLVVACGTWPSCAVVGGQGTAIGGDVMRTTATAAAATTRSHTKIPTLPPLAFEALWSRAGALCLCGVVVFGSGPSGSPCYASDRDASLSDQTDVSSETFSSQRAVVADGKPAVISETNTIEDGNRLVS
jgi:hypothetical protein